MIRAFCSTIACVTALLAALLVAQPAQATLEVNPQVLYQAMKNAYDKSAAAGFDFSSQEAYLASIFNAGRAYSLQRPSDTAYGELAESTVQIGSALHYNPLTNHEAATWYVREAAAWVKAHSTDPTLDADASALLERVNSEEDPETLTRLADADAAANAKAFPGDRYAEMQQAEADWRGWLLTGDTSWRSLALERIAQPDFPLAYLPTTYGPALLQAASDAAAHVVGFTPGDVTNGTIVQANLAKLTKLRVIASVTSLPAQVYLTTLAPADEYFGRSEMSILGIENELKRITVLLDYKYGNRESGETVLVANAIDDLHRVYPGDRDLPTILLECFRDLGRMTTPAAEAAAAHMRAILTVEYQDTPEARALLAAKAAS